MIGRLIFGAISLLLLAAAPASAQRSLYVDGSAGNDTVSRSENSAARPWRTIGRAAWGGTDRLRPNRVEAAQAGDTIVIAAGTYNYAGTVKNRWGVVYNPVNEGTSAANRITFRAAGPVTLTAPATASPVIGCFERDFVVWQGPFDVKEASISIHPDTGTVVMAGGVTGCGVDGISVNGNGQPGYVDNHNGVRVEACTSCFVRNSTITNVRHPRGNHNGSGVMLYDADDTVIENNHIYDVDNAIFIKGVHGKTPQTGTIVRFNLLVNCDSCVTVSFSENARVYQNVIRDSEIGVHLYAEGADAFRHPVGDWIVNNTIDTMSLACVFVSGAWHQRVRIWNNILANCRRGHHSEGAFGADKSAIDWEHNVYDRIATFASDSSGGYSFSQWRDRLRHDSAAPSSSSVNPMFASAAADDFRLCTGRGAPVAECQAPSPVLAVGIDIMDLDGDGQTTDAIPAGAYISNKETMGKQK